MLRASVVTALGFVAITTSAFTSNMRPAFGQSLIGASNIDKYSQYYAPYAIQAAAAYVSVRQMESKKRPRLLRQTNTPSMKFSLIAALIRAPTKMRG